MPPIQYQQQPRSSSKVKSFLILGAIALVIFGLIFASIQSFSSKDKTEETPSTQTNNENTDETTTPAVADSVYENHLKNYLAAAETIASNRNGSYPSSAYAFFVAINNNPDFNLPLNPTTKQPYGIVENDPVEGQIAYSATGSCDGAQQGRIIALRTVTGSGKQICLDNS